MQFPLRLSPSLLRLFRDREHESRNYSASGGPSHPLSSLCEWAGGALEFGFDDLAVSFDSLVGCGSLSSPRMIATYLRRASQDIKRGLVSIGDEFVRRRRLPYDAIKHSVWPLSPLPLSSSPNALVRD